MNASAGGGVRPRPSLQAALAAGEPSLDECVFIERRRLPKTPSGKIQRFGVRQLATQAGVAAGRVVLRD